VATLKDSNQPIIIVRKRKKRAEPHHSGAWKVAYADFVTAMMAFFLLLWLLNVTTADQRQGIADYFTPVSVSKMNSGSGSVLGGLSITVPGAQTSPSAPIVVVEIPSQGRPGYASEAAEDAEEATAPKGGTEGDHGGLGREGDARGSGRAGDEDGKGRAGDQDGTGPAGNRNGTGVRFATQMATPGAPPAVPAGAQAGARAGDPATLERQLADQEQAQFKQAEELLRQAIQSTPELQPLQQNLVIDQTPEGLRIQIVDREGYSMFPSGSAHMFPQTRQLLALVGQAVRQMPNRLSISGHTDSAPYTRAVAYDNWDLSTDRANASRRALVQAGIQDTRIATVVGRADREHLFPNDPQSPRNRRISIVLLSERRALAQQATEPAQPRSAAPANGTEPAGRQVPVTPAAVPALAAPAVPATTPFRSPPLPAVAPAAPAVPAPAAAAGSPPAATATN